MDNKEWSDIIVKCAEDYTKLKSADKVETPPRDFIRAWMQINYSIFKLSGHFFRMFNTVLKKKYDEGIISESFVHKISKTSKESILDDGFIGISEKYVSKFIDAHQESFDKWIKHPKSFKEGHPNVRINKGEKRQVFFGTLEDKIGCYKNIFDEVRNLFLDECCGYDEDGNEISLEEILDSTDSYVFLRAMTLFKGLDGEEPVVEFECQTQYGTDFANKYRIGHCVGSPVNFYCYWSQLSAKAKMEIMMTFKTELEGIEESSVIFKTKRKNLNESFTKKTTSKKTTQDILKRADNFLYQIGDVFPKEGEKIQGIVVADSESLKRNGVLIMTPTFIDGLGKPTSNKGFRTKNAILKAIDLYNKRNGGGWHPLTKEEGLAMGLMENAWEIPWEKQKKVFNSHRDKITSTLKGLGYSSEEIYGTNMLIKDKGCFNMGGWEMNDYNQGNMLRLFKFIDFGNLSESFIKKTSGRKSGSLVSKANELATDIEDIETFVKFLDNYFSENAEDLKAKAKPKELIFNYSYQYKNESRADDWKRHLFEFSFDTIKRKISKKTGNVEKEFISRFTIYICNSIRFHDSFVFEVQCERPWSFNNPSLDSRYESFYFVGQVEVNDPRHERFIIPVTVSKSSMAWKPTLRNAMLFRDMILMIIDNFTEIGKMKDLYPNTKITNAYQESFNEIKDNVYNVSPTSIYR